MDESMRNVVLMFSGILLIGAIVVLLDYLGTRKERRSDDRPPV